MLYMYHQKSVHGIARMQHDGAVNINHNLQDMLSEYKGKKNTTAQMKTPSAHKIRVFLMPQNTQEVSSESGQLPGTLLPSPRP